MLFVKKLIISSVALVLSTSIASAAEYELKLHHFLSPKAPAHKNMLVPWAKKIMEASDGRVKINIFPSMTLGGKPPQLPRQVRDGVVDMAWIVNANGGGLFPRTEVFELPGVRQGSSAAVNMAMYEMYDEFLSKDFKGFFPLFQHVHGGQALHMVDDEVRSPADLAGKKIRIPSRTGAWVIDALGASPVKTSVGEIPVALSKKVVDGALIPFEVIAPLKIQEQTKYQIEGPEGKRFGTTSFSVIINQKKWDSMPKDIQKIFLDASGADWHKEVGDIWDDSEHAGIKIAVDSGNTHIQLTDDEWAEFDKVLQPVTARWIKDMKKKNIDGQALYDRAIELVSKHSPGKQ